MTFENLESIRSFTGSDSELGFILFHVIAAAKASGAMQATVDSLNACLENDREKFDEAIQIFQEILRSINCELGAMWQRSNATHYNDFRNFMFGVKDLPRFPYGVIYEFKEINEDGQVIPMTGIWHFLGEFSANDEIIPTCDNLLLFAPKVPNDACTEIVKDIISSQLSPEKWLSYVRSFSRQVKLQEFALADRNSGLLYLSLLHQLHALRHQQMKFLEEYIHNRTSTLFPDYKIKNREFIRNLLHNKSVFTLHAISAVRKGLHLSNEDGDLYKTVAATLEKYYPESERFNTISEYAQYLNELVLTNPDRFLRSFTAKYIHDEEDLSFPLIKREREIAEIIAALIPRKNRYFRGSVGSKDKAKYVLPVCVGIPGTGKTRLLESYESVFSKMNIKDVLGIILTYYNGQNMLPAEWDLPMDQSLSIRIIHQLFARDESLKSYYQRLNGRYEHYSLETVLSLIANLYRYSHRIGENNQISIFLGIDEYQALAKKHIHKDGHAIKLNELLDLLLQTSQVLALQNIHLYPLLAGTENEKIKKWGSSNNLLKRIRISFLDAKASLQLLQSRTGNFSYLQSLTTRNIIHNFGGICRAIVMFSERIRMTSPSKLSANDLRRIENSISDTVIPATNAVRAKSVIELFAYSFSDTTVLVSDIIPFKLTGRKEEESITWQELADRGIIELRKDKISDSFRIIVPFYFVRMIQSASGRDLSVAERRFIECLKLALRSISATNDASDWQNWELFGASCYALKLNSLAVLGNTSVTLGAFFSHRNALLNPDIIQLMSTEVKVVPTKVIKVTENFSKNSDKNFTENNNAEYKISLLNDKGYVLLNGESGVGVDIMFVLETVDGNKKILVTDQRKRTSDVMNQGNFDSITKLMNSAVPQEVKGLSNVERIQVVSSRWGILGPRFDHKAVDSSSIFYGLEEFYDELLPFTNHPVAIGMVDVNFINQTLLETLFSVNKEMAEMVTNKREANRFMKLEEFENFIGKKVESHIKPVLFFAGDLE
jgi:hypothetical protein